MPASHLSCPCICWWHFPHNSTTLSRSSVFSSSRPFGTSIAQYLADKYGYDIELLPVIDGQKSADTYNHTLQKKQEYKVNKTATASSIDNLIRDGKDQADSIVMRIDSEITLGTLQDAVQNRVNRERNITDVTLIRNGKDVTFTREQIISKSFKIQPEDFR